jgi:cohesin loading factor subunit SCC2
VAEGQVRSENDTARIDSISWSLGSLTAFNRGFDAILGVVLGALDAPAVFMRTKALRSLGQVLASDPTVLKKVSGKALHRGKTDMTIR